MPRWLWILLLGLLLALWWVGRPSRLPITATSMAGDGAVLCPLPPALLDIDQPRQSDVGGRISPFRFGDATVSPLAGFSLQARVLSREDYSLGRESDYSPTDLALGWGPMSAPDMSSKLHVSQGGRWYRYGWSGDGPPMPLDQIIRNSANMHMVPADAGVARSLGRISAGDVVRVDGWLIRIDGDQGWHWQSSLSRDDSGGGACELVLVCSIQSR
jgi:hypothetical protein